MHIYWVKLIVGIIAIAAGILIVKFRVTITKTSVEGQRAMFGKSVGRTMQRRATPFWTGFVGFIAMAVGVIAIVYAFTT